MENQYQVCWICFPQRDGMEPLHGEFVQARRKFFQNPSRSVGIEKNKDIKGYAGSVHGKLSHRSVYWKKKVKGVSGGTAILEEAFRQRDGWVLVTRDLYGVIVSRSYFGKNHLWTRTEYYEPWDSSTAKVIFRPAAGSQDIQRSDWDPEKKAYQTVDLSPAPYRSGTAGQSLVDAQMGVPQLVAATTEGELCFCPRAEAQARAKSLEDISSGTVVLMPAWEVKDGELIRENNKEETNITFTSLEECAKIEPPKPREAKPLPSPEPRPEPAITAATPAPAPEGIAAKEVPLPVTEPEKPAETILVEKEEPFLPVGPATPAPIPPAVPMPVHTAPATAGALIGSLTEQQSDRLLFPELEEAPVMRHAAPAPEPAAPLAAPPGAIPQSDPRFFADIEKPVMRHAAPDSVPAAGPVPSTLPQPVQEVPAPPPMPATKASVPPQPAPIPQGAAPQPGPAVPGPESESGPENEASYISPVVSTGGDDSSLETILVEAALAAESDPSRPAILPRKANPSQSVIPGYQGEIQDGLADGRGRLQQANGVTSYEGEYRQGKRHGFGTYYYKDGNLCYAGSWKDDHRSGLGVSFRDSDHALHVANWKDGRPQGLVSLFDSNGNLRYSGRMVNGKKEGAGVVINQQDGTVFVGQWFQGEATGLGSAFDRDGRLLYYGSWKDGKRHGHGTEFDCNGGVVFDGEFRDDKYYNGVLYQKAPGMIPHNHPYFRDTLIM